MHSRDDERGSGENPLLHGELASLLADGFEDVVAIDSPVIRTSDYLRYLQQRAQALGVELRRAEVSSLDELASEPRVAAIVNCSGLASRELAPDNALYPVRGQVVSVAAPWIRFAFADVDTGAYAIPFPGSDLELGGTAEPHEWRRQPSADHTRNILQKMASVLPSLGRVSAEDTWVGFRPTRSSDGVRVERTTVCDKVLVHNYGHGGSGFTCSWGCARDACRLLLERLPPPPSL